MKYNESFIIVRKACCQLCLREINSLSLAYLLNSEILNQLHIWVLSAQYTVGSNYWLDTPGKGIHIWAVTIKDSPLGSQKKLL